MADLIRKLRRHLSGSLVVPTHRSLTTHDGHPRSNTGRRNRKSIRSSCGRDWSNGRTRGRVRDIGWRVGDCILQLGSALGKYQFVSLHLSLFPVDFEADPLGKEVLKHGFELVLRRAEEHT